MSMSKNVIMTPFLEIGSTQNGTVREAKMLAAIKNRLYLCSAFGKQVRELEY